MSGSTIAPEVDVIDAARSGSRAALEELYRAHAGAVYALAFRITGTREDAEDVLQDVFVGLPRALRSYDERGRFESWLKRVAARTSLMRLRATTRRREQMLDDAPEPSSPMPAEVERIAVRSALARMPENLRVVFVLREIEGYTHDEIGELLHISAGASATRLSRAWSFLRTELKA